MTKRKISMLGGGSGFVINIARELAQAPALGQFTFVVMDVDVGRLDKAVAEVRRILSAANCGVAVEATTDLGAALDGCDYVIASCEKNRYPNWIKDVEIPRRHGVYQLTGENGGPGGQIHAMRSISMFMPILAEMEKRCPRAWLMNFTNPMSFLCTYFRDHSKNPALGFCHQVHGSFGVIAEMLGMPPGELEVVTGGINHFNWLFDIRKRGTNRSFMDQFLQRVRHSDYWNRASHNVPHQQFTLELLDTFDAYCVGYDNHIVEYLPFFHEEQEWAERGYVSIAEQRLRAVVEQGDAGKSLEAMTLLGGAGHAKPSFPTDDTQPYYAEKPCAVIAALETNASHYIDAINIVNHGSISNLPENAIVDVPAVVVGGHVRSVHVGPLPIGPMELCRRQITIHEMVARATHEGDEKLALQSLCLDPWIRSITQARRIWEDFRTEYRDALPTFR